ncbi:hypothetical protein [Nonomuraea sp. NPDC050691]|uniref:hypothetical protein n=1 Tax=Nonomuraea sp. NPDC050691 TaxID=3155661 RepID=UPI00341155D9
MGALRAAGPLGERAEIFSGVRQGGQWWRAVLALGAFGVAAAAVYGIFSSGFGRPPHAAALHPPPAMSPVPVGSSAPASPPPASPPPASPTAGSPAPASSTAGTSAPAPAPAGPALAPPPPDPASTLAVVSGDLWFTYLPAGLTRTGGGVADTGPGSRAAWAVWAVRAGNGPGDAGDGPGDRGGYGPRDRFVEARADHGAIAASWAAYRRTAPPGSRETAVRGRPAMVGRDPRGGRTIVWLERPGTGVRVRVGEPLAGELLPVAASVRSPVGDWGGFP